METTKAPRLRSIEGGASTGPAKAESYGLDPAFERALATVLCKNLHVYAKIGNSIEADALAQPLAQLAVRCAQEFAKEVGKGPGSLLVVIQRLSRWREDGKLTQAKIEEVADLFDSAEDAGLPSDEAVLAEMAPLLQRRVRQAAIKYALEDLARGGDMAKAEKTLARARTIGKTSDVDGSILGSGSFEAIDKLRLVEKMPTGITEVDMLLEGGYPRGLTIYVGESGGGKSMALVQTAAEAAYRKLHVGIVSLELPEEVQLARIVANLTGTPINDLLNGRQEAAKRRMETLHEFLGPMTVRYFSPRATRVEDIFRWIEMREQKAGRKMDLLVVDYLDKLGHSHGEDNAYTAQGNISDALRDYALGKSMWCVTASQAKRGGGRAGKANLLDLEHIADSMHKARVADIVITLRKDDATQTLEFYLAKNRLGIP